MLKKTLKIQASSEDIIDNMFFNELIREGFEHGMIKDPEPWFGYRKKRNLTYLPKWHLDFIKILSKKYFLECEARAYGSRIRKDSVVKELLLSSNFARSPFSREIATIEKARSNETI